MKRRLLILLPLTLLLTAAKPPTYLLDPAQSQAHPDHPDKTHMCGLGTSAESAGKALQVARGEVSRKIRSQLQGEFRQVSEMSTGNSRILSATQRFSDQIVERYSFGHTALIKAVETRAPKRKWKEYGAFACMDRADAAAAMMAELEPKRARLNEASRLATEANRTRNVAAFALQFTIAQRAWEALFDDWIELRIIHMPRAFDLELDLKKMDALRSTAAEWRRHQRISVIVSRSAGDQADVVRGKTQQALQRIGLEATGTAKSCSRPGGSTHVLEITPSQRCRSGSVILTCQLEFEVRLQHCSSGNAVGGRVESQAFRGTDNQFDEDRAMGRAWTKVTSDGMAPGLKKVLGTQLPME